MKFKLLSCLFATSTMLSVQGFKIINNTSQAITVGDFGKGVLTAKMDPIELEAGGEINTNEWSCGPFDRVTVTAFGRNYEYENLKLETVITFLEKKGTLERLRSDEIKISTDTEFAENKESLVVVNNTSTTMYLSNFANETGNVLFIDQMILHAGEQTKVSSEVDIMKISGNDFSVRVSPDSPFRDMREVRSFPTKILKDLLNVRMLKCIEEVSGEITFEQS